MAGASAPRTLRCHCSLTPPGPPPVRSQVGGYLYRVQLADHGPHGEGGPPARGGSPASQSSPETGGSRAESPLWDGSPLRPTPPSLRGMRPTTHEPWAVDEAIYLSAAEQHGYVSLGDSGVDHGGSGEPFEERPQRVHFDRPGFYQPNWEQWAAALSA